MTADGFAGALGDGTEDYAKPPMVAAEDLQTGVGYTVPTGSLVDDGHDVEGDALQPVSEDYAAGLRFAADVVHAEARWQTELAMRAAPGMLAEHDYAAERVSNVEAAIRAIAECVHERLTGAIAEARAEERERIAVAIEAVRSPSLSLAEIAQLDHAARIARWHP